MKVTLYNFRFSIGENRCKCTLASFTHTGCSLLHNIRKHMKPNISRMKPHVLATVQHTHTVRFRGISLENGNLTIQTNSLSNAFHTMVDITFITWSQHRYSRLGNCYSRLHSHNYTLQCSSCDINFDTFLIILQESDGRIALLFKVYS